MKTLHKSYPRPQMVRPVFYLLDGEWTLNGKPICVPFPPQSRASGYNGEIGSELVYERSFLLSDVRCDSWEGADDSDAAIPGDVCWILHIGAADESCRVWVNGQLCGSHEGGYLPFAFDVSDFVDPTKPIRIRIECRDELSGLYPYGKQRKKRGGMWYTPVSGLWKSVWMEAVPKDGIKDIRICPSLEAAEISVSCWNGAASEGEVVLLDADGRESGESFALSAGKARIAPANPHLWTPQNPFLYRFRIRINEDAVDSYFALRVIEVKEDKNRIPRLCLNGRPVFLHGVLDQGYYEEGIYTPAEADAYERDILGMKALGFNCLRKHIKIEPERFYYDCDRLGMLVAQDMVNNGAYHYIRETVLPTVGFKQKRDTGKAVTPFEKRRRAIFEEQMEATLNHLYSHPCIVLYTIFNEGWGQFESDRLYRKCREIDPTRIYDSTSGWFAQKESDVRSEHIYFRNEVLLKNPRPVFLSECGGYGYPVADHLWNPKGSYGYGDMMHSPEELTDKFALMIHEMVLPSVYNGLCGCIYTQLSDVEDEINGLYTYDRKVCKALPLRMQALADEIEKTLEACAVMERKE